MKSDYLELDEVESTKQTYCDKKDRTAYKREFNEYSKWIYAGCEVIFAEHISGDHHQGSYLAVFGSPDQRVWVVEKWVIPDLCLNVINSMKLLIKAIIFI